jgi:hypothetical protein
VAVLHGFTTCTKQSYNLNGCKEFQKAFEELRRASSTGSTTIPTNDKAKPATLVNTASSGLTKTLILPC